MSEQMQESGGSGGRAERTESGRTAIQDVRMLERAMRQRWPMKPEYREAVVNRMVSIVANRQTSERAATSAAKVLLGAESQNQADEHKRLPDLHEHGVSGSLVVGVVQEIMANDPDYIEHCRARAVAADAGPVRPVGKQGPVENGQAPGVYRPGHNGHVNGNGHA